MKADIFSKLQKSGRTNVFRSHPVWVEAFDEYKKVTGDSEVNFKCGSCYRKVLAWLKK